MDDTNHADEQRAIYICTPSEVKRERERLAKTYTILDMPEMITTKKARAEKINLINTSIRMSADAKASFHETYVHWFNTVHATLEHIGKLKDKSNREQRRMVESLMEELGSKLWDMKPPKKKGLRLMN
jgi:hypothetical protein